MISLHAVERGASGHLARIATRPEQQVFSGGLAELLALPGQIDLHEIRQDNQAIGLFGIDRTYCHNHDFASAGDLGLRMLTLDAAMQGKGIGTAVMVALADYLPPLYPQAETLWLTVNFRNTGAISVYRKTGFLDEGEVWLGGGAGPQHIMRIRLQAIQ